VRDRDVVDGLRQAGTRYAQRGSSFEGLEASTRCGGDCPRTTVLLGARVDTSVAGGLVSIGEPAFGSCGVALLSSDARAVHSYQFQDPANVEAFRSSPLLRELKRTEVELEAYGEELDNADATGISLEEVAGLLGEGAGVVQASRLRWGAS